MGRARLAVIGLAVVAVVIAAVVSLGGEDGGKKTPTTPPGTTATTETATGTQTVVTETEPGRGPPVELVLAYSPEKEGILTELVGRWNGEGHVVAGRRVVVDAQKWSSGASESKIARGVFRPEIWSPSSSLWGRLLNFEADKPWVLDENPSIVRTPLVIAMWEAEAKALGWPGKRIGFKEILDLATSQAGWARFGLPTHGSFKLGHTNPDFSTSGLSFVAAQYYTAAGKLEGLTVADVRRPAVRGYVRKIQQSIVHYGDTTLFFADQLKAYGPGYASAVAMEEATLLDFNNTRPPGMQRLVAIYPADGTFVSDNPFIVFDAPWVTALEREAAEAFGKWLLARVTPKVAAAYGFRPGDPRLKPLPPIAKANGVDPAQPARVLGLPEPRVLAAVKQAWHADRKPANVMLVVDVSGSMASEQKLEQARQGLLVFLRQLSPRDRAGLIIFNDEIETIVPVGLFAANAAALRRAVPELVADGDTALFDAVAAGYRAVEALGDASRINAVVLLSDGADTASRSQLSAVVAALRQASSDEARIRIFTIAYGSDAQQGVLEQIAEASGGRAYRGDPDDIEAVYLQISSFF